jgi:hypothetical protein
MTMHRLLDYAVGAFVTALLSYSYYIAFRDPNRNIATRVLARYYEHGLVGRDQSLSALALLFGLMSVIIVAAFFLELTRGVK